MKIVSFSINLEHVGDIIDKNLTEPAAKKIKRKFQFSDEGAREPAASHERIVKNSKIALAVFMSGDVQAAPRLISEKAQAAQRVPPPGGIWSACVPSARRPWRRPHFTNPFAHCWVAALVLDAARADQAR
jgi:hypothetical protein